MQFLLETKQVQKMNDNNSVEMELLLDVLNECGTIRLPVQGRSMQPFLKEGRDSAVLNLPDGNIKKGDIVVYKRKNAYFMHRIVDVQKNTVSIMGDNEINPDNGVEKSNIVAVVNEIRRDGKTINKNDFLWKFYSDVYINMKIRKIFLKLHKIRKG